MNERLDRCTQLHNLIQDKLEKAFSDHNVTQKQLRDYFESPQHFSQKEWQLIQDQKDEIKKQLKDLVPQTHEGEKKATHKSASEQKKPKIMQTKSRWMPMR